MIFVGNLILFSTVSGERIFKINQNIKAS